MAFSVKWKRKTHSLERGKDYIKTHIILLSLSSLFSFHHPLFFLYLRHHSRGSGQEVVFMMLCQEVVFIPGVKNNEEHSDFACYLREVDCIGSVLSAWYGFFLNESSHLQAKNVVNIPSYR